VIKNNINVIEIHTVDERMKFCGVSWNGFSVAIQIKVARPQIRASEVEVRFVLRIAIRRRWRGWRGGWGAGLVKI
jgi:hypothetical protein